MNNRFQMDDHVKPSSVLPREILDCESSLDYLDTLDYLDSLDSLGFSENMMVEHIGNQAPVETQAETRFQKQPETFPIQDVKDSEDELKFANIITDEVTQEDEGSLVKCRTLDLNPCRENLPEQYNFTVAVENPDKKTKARPYAYSKVTNRLYAQPQELCRLKFSCDLEPPPNSYIRALPIYKEDKYSHLVVECCPTCCTPNVPGIATDVPANHVVRCVRPDAFYNACAKTKKLSVIVPYEGSRVDYLYTFYCSSTCKFSESVKRGSVKRGPVEVIFYLEWGGTVLAQRVLPTKVCSCPGRDMGSDERKAEPNASVKTDGVASNPANYENSGPNSGPFNIQIPDYEHFVKVKCYYESLLRAEFTLEELQQFHNEKKLQKGKRTQAAVVGPPAKKRRMVKKPTVDED